MSTRGTPLPHPLCAHFNSKKLCMVGQDQPVVLEDLETAGYDTYWCAHTFTDTGPDGGWVQFDRCKPGRDCFHERGASASG